MWLTSEFAIYESGLVYVEDGDGRYAHGRRLSKRGLRLGR